MFDRILVPLDGSREAESVFPLLRRLLKRKDAEVILFQSLFLPLMAQVEHVPPVLSGMEREASDLLEGWKARLEGAGARVRLHVGIGRPADAILKAAKDLDASIIAMSTHGRSGFVRWMMGSVTEDVLRRCEIPVFVARANAPEPPASS